MSIHYVMVGTHGFRLRTQFVYPPIPSRTSDWSVVDDERYDGPGSLIAYGPTEADAIEEFLQQVKEDMEEHPEKYE